MSYPVRCRIIKGVYLPYHLIIRLVNESIRHYRRDDETVEFDGSAYKGEISSDRKIVFENDVKAVRFSANLKFLNNKQNWLSVRVSYTITLPVLEANIGKGIDLLIRKY